MVRMDSSKSNAGRTPERSSQCSTTPSGTRTMASTTVVAGPGTMISRTRRSVGAPARWPAMVDFGGGSSVTVAKRAPP